jgi:hypothetical protein
MTEPSTSKLNLPEHSEWKCYMFGNHPGGNGIVYQPYKGDVPNVFVRWMMKICFDCKWMKVKNEN